MKDITGGTAPALLWSDFMKKAHIGKPPKALSDSIIKVNRDEENKSRIERLIKKSKEMEKRKNVFEKILDNFF